MCSERERAVWRSGEEGGPEDEKEGGVVWERIRRKTEGGREVGKMRTGLRKRQGEREEVKRRNIEGREGWGGGVRGVLMRVCIPPHTQQDLLKKCNKPTN